MLAHAASAQGISAVENMCGRPYVLNHNSVPAACFTHPEVRPDRNSGTYICVRLESIIWCFITGILCFHDCYFKICFTCSDHPSSRPRGEA